MKLRQISLTLENEEVVKIGEITIDISCSPSKRLGLCGECIEQLGNWHASLEKGATVLF